MKMTARKLPKPSPTAAADRVLSCFPEVFVAGAGENEEYRVEPYRNGREAGFALTRVGYDFKVAFAEYRSSDHIVIYSGARADFTSNAKWNVANEPSPAVYERKRMIGPEKIWDAAELVWVLFRDHARAVEKAARIAVGERRAKVVSRYVSPGTPVEILSLARK